MYQVNIDFQAQKSPSDTESRRGTHSRSEKFHDLEEAIEFIEEHTEIENLAESGSSMYVDRETEEGTKTVEVGKVYSYWKEYHNRERGTYNVWETAWVEIKELEVDELPIEDAIEQVNEDGR